MRSLSKLVPLLCLLLTGGALAFAQPDTSGENSRIAEQFIPEGWRELNPHARTDREFAVSPVVLDPSGKKSFVVAAYSNGRERLIRLIQKAPAGSLLAGDMRIEEAAGFGAQLLVHDLDRDGKEEIVVQYRIGGKLWSEVLRWDGLRLIEVDRRAEVEFRDADGDGALELIETATAERVLEAQKAAQELARGRAEATLAEGEGEGEVADAPEVRPMIVPNRVFRYRAGRFVAAEAEYYLARVGRKSGELSEHGGHFEVNSRSGRYYLQIVNGEEKGSLRVEQGEIWLNGVKVMKPEQFVSGRSRLIQLPVTPQLKNEVKIRILAPQSARMVVSFIAK